MGQWGWRPLICFVFISVLLIVACSATSPLAPETSSTQLPVLTLTTHAPRDNLTNSTLYLPITATIIHTVSIVSTPNQFIPTPLPTEIISPTCYETFNDDVECFGLVLNPHDYALSRIALEGQLITIDGAVIATTTTILDQQTVPGKSHAPYRLRFNMPPQSEQVQNVIVRLTRAERSPHANTNRLASLSIIENDITRTPEHYRFDIGIRNENDVAAPPLQLIIILFDGSGRVLGYRLQNIETIAPDTTHETVLQITTRGEPTAQHEIYVVSQ